MSGQGRRNRSLAFSMAALALGMVLLAYASVPLYRLFCATTGFGGTPQRAAQAPGSVSDRVITIRFNADTDADLPWEFHPNQPEMQVRVGEQALTTYHAKNLTDKVSRGHAVYNVVPDAAGAYFTKIECFCFKDQSLKPHQATDMPVIYYIDPALLHDPALRNLRTITLSYTFFAAKNASQSPSLP